MDTYKVLTTCIAVLALAALFVAPIALYKWWRWSRRADLLRGQLRDRTREAHQLATATEELLEERDKFRARLEHLAVRFGGVFSLDDELQRLRDELAALTSQQAELRADYQAKKEIHAQLVKEVAVFDERLAFAEVGMYEPHFDFSDSETYKAAITETRDRQKALITAETAVVSANNWTVDGSLEKGRTMMKRNIKLTLRAFNGECDAAIANTRWNNAAAMEKRMARAREQLDKLNASNTITIAKAFFDLKLAELRLTHEYREKLKAEREQRAEQARLAREEQKLIRDMERAQEEEDYYAKLLAKARSEAERASGPQLAAFTTQIEALERDLAAAHAKFERAESLAERTRTGYVYVISNIGSFGDDVVKIGLTRRLDPLDRVRELGDASVPFYFDTHAIIYSEDAPALERALHSEFEASRINAQNLRKEFFRVSLGQVEEALQRIAPDAPFFKDIEAQEYRETLSRRRAVFEDLAAFPDSI